MSGVEDSAIRNVTKWEKNKSIIKAEQFIKEATSPLITVENMKIFSDTFPDDAEYNEASVNNDIRYTNRKEGKIKEYDLVARSVEYMVGTWLDSDKIFDNGANSKSPKAAKSSDYDDYSHGVDVAKTWVLSGEDADKCKTNKLTIAIDVTTSKKDSTIYNGPNGGFGKLSQFSNGLPYGFTSIKYYAEQEPSSNKILLSDQKTCVPRFVVGIDKNIVSYMLRNNEVTDNIDQNTPRMILIRFKVLSEIRNQATLFLEKLPEGEEFNAPRSFIETILKRTEKCIIECAESMTPYPIESSGNWKPTFKAKNEVFLSSEAEKLEKDPPLKGHDAVFAIEELIKDKNLACYDATFTAILNGVERFRQDNPGVCNPEPPTQ